MVLVMGAGLGRRTRCGPYCIARLSLTDGGERNATEHQCTDETYTQRYMQIMDLSATYMIWRSDVICCKTPGPRVGLSHVKQSGALWTYRAQTAIISIVLAVCEERVLGSNSHHLSIARKG